MSPGLLSSFLPVAAAPISIVSLMVHSALTALGLRAWSVYGVAGAMTGSALGLSLLRCPHGTQGAACLREAWGDWLTLCAMPGFGAALAFWTAFRPDAAPKVDQPCM